MDSPTFIIFDGLSERENAIFFPVDLAYLCLGTTPPPPTKPRNLNSILSILFKE